jgi:nucleoside-diphosphate-sugar epimerase
MRIFWTGDKGFIAGYAIQNLLDKGHIVIGIDNNWKYGKIKKSYHTHKNYHHFYMDAKNKFLMKFLVWFYKPEIMVNGAALIGGISFFHKLAGDLISENEEICSTFFKTAIYAYKKGFLKKILAISSSMVYESATKFPSKEGDERKISPPLSTYGFQKLSVEYFCQGYYEQYGLPYTIIRPFNAVGLGEQKAKVDEKVMSGTIELAMSHVVVDFIQKIIKGQNPLRILGDGNQIRYYTPANDLADGIEKAIFSEKALNEDFNLSTNRGLTVLELAKIIWNLIQPEKEFSYISDKPFKYDVQCRIPDTIKAKEILNFESKTLLENILRDEVIPWVREMIKLGKV